MMRTLWLVCGSLLSLLATLAHGETYSYQGELVFDGSPGSLCAAGHYPVQVVGRDDAPGLKFDAYLFGAEIVSAHFSGNDLNSLIVKLPGESAGSHTLQLQPTGQGSFAGALQERSLVGALSGCATQRASLRFSRNGLHVAEAFAQAAQLFQLDDAAATAYVRTMQGKAGEAAGALNQGAAAKERVLGPDHPQLLPYRYFLAKLKDLDGRYSEESQLLRQALSICDKTTAALDLCRALMLSALGESLIKNGDYQEAEAALKRADGIASQLAGGQLPLSGALLNSESAMFIYTGRYAEAESTLERAVAINTKNAGPKSPAVATSLLNRGVLYRYIGEPAKAEAVLRQALAINQEGLSPESPLLILNLIDLSQVLRFQKKYAEAETLARRALAAARNAPALNRSGNSTLLLAQVSLAQTLVGTRRFAEADSLYRDALQAVQKSLGADAPEVGLLSLLTAESLEAQDKARDALPLLKRAYQISHHTQNKIIAWRVPAALMRHYARIPDGHDLGIYYGKEAISTLETQRANLAAVGQEAQDAFVAADDVGGVYRELTALLITEQRFGEAQAIRSLTKSEELTQYSEGSVQVARPAPLAFEGSERPAEDSRSQLIALGKEYGALQEKYRKEGELTAQDRARLEVLRKSLDKAQAEFEARASAIASNAHDPEAKRRRAQEITDFTRAFQGTLKEFEHPAVLVQYFMLDDRLEILLTTPNALLARESKIGRDALTAKVQHFRSALANTSADPLPEAQELYAELIAPIATDLKAAGVSTLMLSLDDSLRYLPFAALHDGQGYLVESYSLSIVTEAVRDKLLKPSNPKWRVWGLGVTQGGADYPALPFAGEELNAIAGPKGILGGKVLLDRQFSEASLRDGLDQGYPIIHIASHFQFTPGSMNDSFLLLGDGTRLTLGAIKTKLNFGSVELLALSACETGLGDAHSTRPGAEVEGLGAIAQQAGAQAVLASLWPVADRSTALLMRRLYEAHAKDHFDKADSLKAAQLELLRGTSQSAAAGEERRGLARMAGSVPGAGGAKPASAAPKAPFAHPFYWAPFILMGNWQ
jgi:CHAT domain-containing protein